VSGAQSGQSQFKDLGARTEPFLTYSEPHPPMRAAPNMSARSAGPSSLYPSWRVLVFDGHA